MLATKPEIYTPTSRPGKVIYQMFYRGVHTASDRYEVRVRPRLYAIQLLESYLYLIEGNKYIRRHPDFITQSEVNAALKQLDESLINF